MRIRILTPFLALAIVACGAETAEDTADTAMADDTQEYAASADAASLVEFTENWATHYNMGHGSMVADFFVDDGMMWSGAGGFAFGKDNIDAMLTGAIEATSPQLTLTHGDQIIAGNVAVAYGTYENTAEAGSNSGGWLTYAEMIDGEWKLHGLMSSIGEGQEAPNFTMGEMPPAHESAAMMAEGAEYFQTHFNMGHADMAASNYADDVINIGAPENGRAALEANLQALIDQGAQVEVMPFAAAQIGEDHVSSVGTFAVTIDGQTATGHYGNVARVNDDGTNTVIWSIVSNHPVGGM